MPAAGKRRLTTSGMSAGASEVAATQKKSRKRGSGADDGRQAATLVAVCAKVRVMNVTSAIRETAQPAEAAETVAPSQAGWDVPAAKEEMLSTSGMLADASEDAATQEGSRQLQGRDPRYSRDADRGAESRRQKLRTGLSHRVRVTGSCPAAWPDEPPGGSRVPPEGSIDPRPSREPRPPWTASPRRSKGEATRRRSGNGRPQQQQRAAGKQQTAAGRCEREQMGQVANAAREKQLADGFQLQEACPEVRELYLNILGVQRRLSCAIGDGDGAVAIENHCQALLSEVRRIEGAVSREAQTRGWDLIEIEDLVQRMLEPTRYALRDADRALCELKAAHHAARVEVLAGEAVEVWSKRSSGLGKTARGSVRSSTGSCRHSARQTQSLGCTLCWRARGEQPICERTE